MAGIINRLRLAHPGEVVHQDYMVPLGLNVHAVALGVPATRMHDIVKERRSSTADTALRLAPYFGGDAASWLALQARHDLKTLPTREEIEQRVVTREALAA